MATAFLKPQLPSTAVDFRGDETLSIAPNGNEVVAVVGPASWGPVNAAPSLAGGRSVYLSLSEFERDFGTADTPLRTAVVGAFSGMGLPGQGGAGGVIPIRAATSAAAAASKTLQNTTPAAALTLTAKYKGVDGNQLSYVVEDDPVIAGKDRLRILFRGIEVERFSYNQTDITGLRDAINNRPSAYVVASAATSGTALAPTTGSAFTGGNDGAVLTATEYLAAQAILEFQDFGIFAPAGLTDVSVKVQLAAWNRQMAEEMRPFRMVFGGAAGEDIDDVIAELSSNPTLRDPHIIRFGVGTWHDDSLNKDLGTAELAPRLAGVLAARGLKSSLTRADFATLSPVGNLVPTTQELVQGRDQGITMLRRVSSERTTLAIAQGVSTFTSTTTEGRPFRLWSEPRLVGLFDATIRRIVKWGDDVVIGDLPVNDDTRNLVRKEVGKILAEYEGNGLAEPGTQFIVVDPPNDPNLDDTIPFEFGFKPTRTANYLIGQGRVR